MQTETLSRLVEIKNLIYSANQLLYYFFPCSTEEFKAHVDVLNDLAVNEKYDEIDELIRSRKEAKEALFRTKFSKLEKKDRKRKHQNK